MHLKNLQLMSDDDRGILASQSLCMTEMFLYELEMKFQTKDCEAIVLICGSFKDYKLISTSKDEPDFLFLKIRTNWKYPSVIVNLKMQPIRKNLS